MNLNDLIPRDAEIEIGDRILRLRKITLEDRIWCKDKFGIELEMVCQRLLFSDLMQILYHQLTDACKRDFLAEKKELVDDDGNVTEVLRKGWEVLSSIVANGDDIQKLADVLAKIIGISSPVIEIEENKDLKKKKMKK